MNGGSCDPAQQLAGERLMTDPKGSGEVIKVASAVVGMGTGARRSHIGASGAKPRAMETDAKYFRRRAREEFFAAIRRTITRLEEPISTWPPGTKI
jgi:hypothetical protein